MKQLSLLATLAVAASGVGEAQAQNVRVGLKGGPSYTTVVGQNVDGAAYKWGFHGGVLVNFKLSDRLSLQPEVLYSQKGTKEENSTTRIDVNYVDLPVVLRVTPGLGGLFVEAGPQLGYLAGSTSRVDTRKPLARVTTDFAGSYPHFDVGYAVGFGYQLDSGLGIGLRYNGGLTHVLKGATDDDTARNSAFQLYLSALVGKGR
ncbi:PorT family protein [Microvirga sp. STS02]|uniref:porin family protein n=1 Tax=Hymenobacter negativus TaxID=2795026 RepID=UPI0018DD5FF6|nr:MULTISPECIES: porin family protein [Bacteria]MBH8570552.1 PorT family protein [Hymenobacter negativus]MBR7210291.1 PorT family protein [Microvirga sp. STS02]